jgi:hypothetical protein
VLLRPSDSTGHDAVTSVSDTRLIVADAKAGCVGGIVTVPHDTAVVFQLSATTGGPACVGGSVAVGAVGEESEQPIANANTSPQRMRVTKPPTSRGLANYED